MNRRIFIRMYKQYLQEQQPVLYEEFCSSATLDAHLNDEADRVQEMFERLVKEYAEKQCITEALKAENQMEWVGKMNAIHSAVDEVIMAEYY